MKRTILGLLSLGCILLMGCTQQKVDKVESVPNGQKERNPSERNG